MSVGGSTEQLSALLPLVKSAATEITIIGYVKQAISNADIYVFGELLALENVQKLAQGSPDAKKAFSTLELFCYGRYSDFTKQKDNLLPLSDKQSRKLKQLSIVSLAAENRIIPYQKLLAELDVPNLRELEDLVIDAFYRGIIVGKLDHAASQLQVDSALGRDVRPTDVDAMIRALRNWEAQSKQLLAVLEDTAKRARAAALEHDQHQTQFNKKLEESKVAVKTALDTEADTERGGAAGMMSMMAHMMGGADFRGAKPGKKDGGGKFKPGRHAGY